MAIPEKKTVGDEFVEKLVAVNRTANGVKGGARLVPRAEPSWAMARVALVTAFGKAAKKACRDSKAMPRRAEPDQRGVRNDSRITRSGDTWRHARGRQRPHGRYWRYCGWWEACGARVRGVRTVLAQELGLAYPNQTWFERHQGLGKHRSPDANCGEARYDSGRNYG